MTLEALRSICEANGLPLSEEQASLLGKYEQLLREWNAKINLISRKDEENILSRHILHSLTLRMPAICDYDFAGKKAADVGTGGGLPGIPLKIVTASLDLTLIDSIQKKITACNGMIASLKLNRIRAIVGRAEELAKLPDHRKQYDAIVSRAVAPLDDLLKWCGGLLKDGGTLYSLKGGDLSEEIKRTERMKIVDVVESRSLRLVGYDEFEREEKQLIRVKLKKV